MDWEYYIDSDVSNSIIRGLVFYGVFRFWHKNMVSKDLMIKLNLKFFNFLLDKITKHPRTS
jgi:hypothetical protein